MLPEESTRNAMSAAAVQESDSETFKRCLKLEKEEPDQLRNNCNTGDQFE